MDGGHNLLQFPGSSPASPPPNGELMRLPRRVTALLATLALLPAFTAVASLTSARRWRPRRRCCGPPAGVPGDDPADRARHPARRGAELRLARLRARLRPGRDLDLQRRRHPAHHPRSARSAAPPASPTPPAAVPGGSHRTRSRSTSGTASTPPTSSPPPGSSGRRSSPPPRRARRTRTSRGSPSRPGSPRCPTGCPRAGTPRRTGPGPRHAVRVQRHRGRVRGDDHRPGHGAGNPRSRGGAATGSPRRT